MIVETESIKHPNKKHPVLHYFNPIYTPSERRLLKCASNLGNISQFYIIIYLFQNCQYFLFDLSLLVLENSHARRRAENFTL